MFFCFFVFFFVFCCSLSLFLLEKNLFSPQKGIFCVFFLCLPLFLFSLVSLSPFLSLSLSLSLYFFVSLLFFSCFLPFCFSFLFLVLLFLLFCLLSSLKLFFGFCCSACCLDATNNIERAQNADVCRKPQIFADSPLLLEIQAFGGRRKPQKTADFAAEEDADWAPSP